MTWVIFLFFESKLHFRSFVIKKRKKKKIVVFTMFLTVFHWIVVFEELSVAACEALLQQKFQDNFSICIPDSFCKFSKTASHHKFVCELFPVAHLSISGCWGQGGGVSTPTKHGQSLLNSTEYDVNAEKVRRIESDLRP